jgi:hypothetical protein
MHGHRLSLPHHNKATSIATACFFVEQLCLQYPNFGLLVEQAWSPASAAAHKSLLSAPLTHRCPLLPTLLSSLALSPALSCPLLSSPALSCPLLPSLVLSCPLLSSLALSYPLLSSLALSYPLLPFPACPLGIPLSGIVQPIDNFNSMLSRLAAGEQLRNTAGT